MNLEEIRIQLVKLTGRYDLVSDFAGGDYTDVGANFFIQLGSRYLDSRLLLDSNFLRYQKDIVSPDAFLPIPSCRAIKKVRATGVDGRIILSKKSITDLEGYYGSMAMYAAGEAVFSDNPAPGDIITVDSDTYTFGTDIDIETLVQDTIDNAVATINAGTSTVICSRRGTHILRVRSIDYGYAGNSIAFTATSGKITVDGSGTLGGTTPGCEGELVDTGAPLYYVPTVVGLTNAQKSLTHKTFGKDFTYDAEGLILGDYESYRGILIMPPVDGAYTVTIFGSFYSKDLSDDKDENFWSVMHPGLLILASMRSIEAFYRNTEGLRDMEASMEPEIIGIEKDVVAEEIADADSMKRPDFEEDYYER